MATVAELREKAGFSLATADGSHGEGSEGSADGAGGTGGADGDTSSGGADGADGAGQKDSMGSSFEGADRAVESVYCCDLLSVVMGKAPAGCA